MFKLRLKAHNGVWFTAGKFHSRQIAWEKGLRLVLSEGKYANYDITAA